MKDIYAIIPAYEPMTSLPALVREVAGLSCLAGVVVVDDGSVRPGTGETFSEIEKIARVTVIHHEVNKGKGAAMKTAFRYLLAEAKAGRIESLLGAVTVDADGQHLPVDIEKVVLEFFKHPEDYVLGVRDFHALEKKIPLRSRFGNLVTEKVFGFFTHSNLKDTQTGLRVYSKEFMAAALEIKPDRYEFELEALLRYSRNCSGILRQVPITTVYEENNPSSHFRPLRDSLRIYAIFLKFIGASVISSIVDYIVFAVMICILGADKSYGGHSAIFYSLLVARLISASLNFILDKKAVFKSNGQWLRQSLCFVALAVFLFVSSCYGMNLLARFGVHPLVSKILVEGLLFFLSFLIQDKLIFRKRIR